MKNCILTSLLAVLLLVPALTRAQSPVWHLRLVAAPSFDDNLGIGISYRPEGHIFHQAEVYPLYTTLTTTVPDITDRRAFGLAYRLGYCFLPAEKNLQVFLAGEPSFFYYSRIFNTPTPGEQVRTQTYRILTQAGVDYRFARRFHVNAALPVTGLEFVRDVSDAQTSFNATFFANGILGLLLPRFGVEIGW
ncbi:MAG: hypothetical protein SF053_17175 [Bacteroidia bacterium]|nr:hypothetical protein [Bacteroidia bacterium]